MDGIDRSRQETSLETAAPEGLQGATPCWSQTGVYGDNTCARLELCKHCHHCPVFSSAAGRLLDRPLPHHYLSDWTMHFAVERPSRKAVNGSAMLFRLRQEWLGLPTLAFQEVAERRPIHSLPHRAQSATLGLANVRGELLICISLGHLLGLSQVPPTAVLRQTYQRLLVVGWDGNRLGFPVDEVQGPHRFHSRELQPAPGTIAKATSHHVQGLFNWRSRPVGLLNPHQVFASTQKELR